MATAGALGISGGRALPRIDEDDLGAARRHPFGEQDGLVLERVDAGDVDHVGLLPVLVGGGKAVDAVIVDAGRVIGGGGLVMLGGGGRADRAESGLGESGLGDGVSIFLELIGIVFAAPRCLAVLLDDLFR